ncbi:MAG: gliding motility-associated protein GldE [Bacteroidetes bacterium]|nr:MAG: gliding motility-associated protein GldE [Bacteroidota bacterium]
MEPEHLAIILQNILMPLTPGATIGMVVVVLLLFCSAMISGSEVAYFSISPQHITKLKENPGRKNQIILNHLEKPERLLANILISNNFANVGIIIISSFVTASLFDFSDTPVLGFVFKVILITSMLLLFGEIIPKVYANKFAPSFASRMALPLLVLDRVFNPLIFILIKSTKLVNRRLSRKGINISMNDLSEALYLTSDVVEGEMDMLEGIVRFNNLEASEIMCPRTDVTAVDIHTDLKALSNLIIESGFSRIPVYDETPDFLKGILYVKDLLPHLNREEDFRWQELIREPFYVPESKKINDLLKEFQEKKIHMAIVVDEYGGTEGIVTMEDILEEVVGEITDESDEEEHFYRRIDARTTIFDGKTLLNDFFKITELDDELFDDVRGEAETLAGLILELKGEFPRANEIVRCKNIEFTVLGMDNRRIREVKVFIRDLVPVSARKL